jgi:protein SCO1/2
LYCYHYDPTVGKYGAVVGNMLKIGGAFTILVLGGMILILFRLEKAATRRKDWSHVGGS